MIPATPRARAALPGSIPGRAREPRARNDMAEARPTWKGFLRLSLVTVPVRALPAHTPSAEIRLNQLHAECHNRIKYQKACPEHGEVRKEEIVSGYEYQKGQYVVVDPAELQKIRPQSDKTIRIDGFIGDDEVDELYLAGRTYYLLPDGAVGQKPYALLHRAMLDNRVQAIAQVVISSREHVVLVRPMGRLLAMSLLSHENRVRLPAEFEDEVAPQELTADELALTKTLIAASRIQEFDFAKYEDPYVVNLTKLIEAKVEGQEIVQVADPEEPKILNLMEALKRSVAQAQLG